MNLKDRMINNIIDIEGGYVDNKDDSGGPTKYGITEMVARNYGYNGDMKDLSRRTAYNIYSDIYWSSVKADVLLGLSERIAFEVVDTGINCGVERTSVFLQRCLNVFNNRGKYYDDIDCDGVIGPATLHALSQYLIKRDENILVVALNSLQGAYYIKLAERREKDEAFIQGWISKRVTLNRSV